MSRRVRLRLAVVCSALSALAVLSACAGGGEPGERGGRSRPERPLPNVFVSPEGEPFHAPLGAPYPVAVWFAAADADHDGRLTRAEFEADADRFFTKLDTNHDGVIDGAEVQDYEQTIAPEILPQLGRLHAEEGMDPSLTFGDPSNRDSAPSERNGRPMDGQGQEQSGGPVTVGEQGASLFGLLNEPEPVAASDAGFDGRITRAEFRASADRRFDALDKKGLGYLSLSTLPKTPVQKEIETRARRDAARRRSAERR